MTTVEALLAAKVTVEFDQLSLQEAIAETQKRVTDAHKPRFPFRITISGNDLKLEGITRNQQIRAFSQRGKSLADVLTALVVQANPVRNVKSPAERNQKLVWLVVTDKKSILISTRSAANARSDKLPEVFRPK